MPCFCMPVEAIDFKFDADGSKHDPACHQGLNEKRMHKLLIQLESLLRELKELMTEDMKNSNSITKLLCPPGQEESTTDSLKKLLLKLNEDEAEAYTIYRTLNAYVQASSLQIANRA